MAFQWSTIHLYMHICLTYSSTRERVNGISVIYNTFIYAYMPHIHMLQLNETWQSVTIGPLPDIPDILNKYFARSTWTIFTFPSFKAIFEKSYRNCLTNINRHLLPELASMIWRIALSPYFNERGFSVWKMLKFLRLYISSLNLKIWFIMSGERPFRCL